MADLSGYNPRRPPKRGGRPVRQRLPHEIGPDGRGGGPARPPERGGGVVVSYVHGAHQVGGVPHEPCVGVVLSGPRLACSWAGNLVRDARSRPPLAYDLLEDVGHDEGGPRVQHLPYAGSVSEKLAAAPVLDRHDEHGLDALASVGERCERRGHLERRDFGRPEGEREVGPKRALDAESPRVLGALLRADDAREVD